VNDGISRETGPSSNRKALESGKRLRRKSLRQRKLISAARALFHEKGFAATTIDDIIVRTGGSRGTLYIYFGSKLDLFELIVREEAERFSQMLSEALALAKGREADIHDVAEQIFRIATDEEAIGLLRMVIAERQKYPGIGEIYRGIISTVQTAVRRIFRQFTEARGNRVGDPDFLADLFLAIVVADAQLAILTGLADERSEEQLRRVHQRLAMLLTMQRPAETRN
jgi:AcrR family transcriptional regulator